MKTDINRLHEVIQKRLNYRGAGKTTACIYNLIGIIELGESRDIVCVMSQFNDLYYLKNMINKIFEEYGLEIQEYRNNWFMCNNKKIRFETEKDLNRKLSGLNAHIIYMRHKD